MSRLFPELDEEATVSNVKQLLSKYHHIRGVAQRPVGQLKSAVISDMLRGDSYGNHVENDYIAGISAQQVEVNCRFAIDAIENYEYRQILHDKYIGYSKKDVAIMNELNLPEKTFYRHFKQACLSFAEIYGIQELRVFKSDSKVTVERQ